MMRRYNTSVSRTSVFIGIIIASLLFTSSLFAQSAPTLTPELEKTFKKGLISAEKEQWEQAIRYFSEVQEGVPTHPDVLFNLGVAYSHQGQLLPALTYLKAYLAASPNADNIEAIEDELINLEMGIEERIRKTFEKSILAAKALPAEEEREDSKWNAFPRNSALGMISYYQCRTGDIDGALAAEGLKTEEKYGSVSTRQYLMVQWGQKLVEMGDLEAAQEILRKIPDGEYSKEGFHRKFLNAQAKFGPLKQIQEGFLKRSGSLVLDDLQDYIELLIEKGLWKDVFAAVDLVKDSEQERFAVWKFISEKQIEAGDIKGAKNSIDKMLQVYPDPSGKLTDLASAYTQVGDLERAEEIFDKMPSDSFDRRGWQFANLVIAYFKAGQKSKAQALFKEISHDNIIFAVHLGFEDGQAAEDALSSFEASAFDPYGKDRVIGELIYLRIKNGENAQSTMQRLLKKAEWKEYALNVIAARYAKDGNIPEALRVSEMIARGDDYSYIYHHLIDIGQAYLKAGNLDAALEFMRKEKSSLLAYSDQAIALLLKISDEYIKRRDKGKAISALQQAEIFRLIRNKSYVKREIALRLKKLWRRSFNKQERAFIVTHAWVDFAKQMVQRNIIVDVPAYFSANEKWWNAEIKAYRIATVAQNLSEEYLRLQYIEKGLRQ